MALLAWTAVATTPLPLRAGQPLSTPLSELATRTLRKQLKDKQLPFQHAAFSGHVTAVEPDTRLAVEVRDFKLAGDVMSARLHGTGRFKIVGKGPVRPDDPSSAQQELGMLADVELSVAVEARFLKEGGRFFVEPRVHELDVNLKFLEFTPANLSGSEALFSQLARAIFARYKDQIIAEVNKQLDKQPF